MVAALVALVVLEAALVQQQPPKGFEHLFSDWGSTARDLHHDRVPLVVLFEGTSPNRPGSWSTAYWAGWGAQYGNLQDGQTVALPWAAAGVEQAKGCDVPCFVTRDQAVIPLADAVVMEVINHPRTFGSEPFPFPQRYQAQLWGSFFFEPEESFSELLRSPAMTENLDFTMSPSSKSTLPVTLVCPWGRSEEDFLLPPPAKEGFVCTFSHGVAMEKQLFMRVFLSYVQVNAFVGDDYPANLPDRMAIMAKHKFTFVTEAIISNDWVSPEWSQAIMAGSVPVYLGAANIDRYSPGRQSYINASLFESGEALAKYLIALNENDGLYMQYFAWKERGLSRNFREKLSRCAHFGECRVCHLVLETRAQRGIDSE